MIFGGSPIGNSRVKLTNIEDCVKKGYVDKGSDPLQVAADQLVSDGVNILHTIGGDDANTMAAQSIILLFKKNGYDLTVVGLPKTVDNDVFPVAQTLGAWTAAEQSAIFLKILLMRTLQVEDNLSHEVMGETLWLVNGKIS